MAKAIGYFREEDPPREGQPSLAEQNRAFLEFCRRSGYDVAATFLDYAGPEQSGFRQMIEYLRRDVAGTTVVVDRLECLGRDVRQTAQAYFQLDSLGVDLVLLDGTDNVTAALLGFWRGRDGSQRLGERVRDAMRRKAIKGEVLGKPPYGYRIGPRRRLDPLPEEAATVRYIYRLYTQESLGIRLIARRLNEEGYRTRRGRNWSMVTIRDILRNRAYLGTYARFGVRVPGNHLALVTAQEYQRAQDRMGRRRSSSTPRSPQLFVLSGIVSCGYCGNRLIGVSRRQHWRRRSDGVSVEAEYRYYQCETRTNQSMCNYHTRRAADLEEEVRANLEAALQSESTVAGEAAEPKPRGRVAPQHALKLRRRLLDRHLEQVLDDGAAERLPVAEVHRLALEIAQQQLALETELIECERRAQPPHLSSQHEAHKRQERLALARALAAAAWQTRPVAEQQQLLRRLIECITVRDDGLTIRLWPV